jgi:demethylmenaquinone methyltransferase/2-methoxy-6-polyprenyl-1,4-benzoquinol methylase
MTDSIYNPEYVKGLFNRMSSSYERMNYITSFGFSIRWRTQFLEPLQSKTDKIEIIDLLTGMGETWGAVKNKFPNAKLSALDFSTEMLKNAKKNSEQHFDSNVLLLQQDILKNDLPSNYYDIVICAFGLKTFDTEQLQILATETKRILKKGGQFSFIEVSKPTNKFLKQLYSFYLGQIIPILGKLLLGNPTEYKMLWRYTDKFVNAKIAEEIFNNQGLTTKSNSYFYGCSTGFSGHKP